MKKALLTVIILLFCNCTFASKPMLFTIVTNDYVPTPQSFYYSTESTLHPTHGSGGLTPYNNIDIAFIVDKQDPSTHTLRIELGDQRNEFCILTFNSDSHQFTWIENNSEYSPYLKKTYHCAAHYFEKYQHGFIYVVDEIGADRSSYHNN